MIVGIFVVVWCVMISSSVYNCLLNVTGSPQDKGTKIMITQMNGKNLLSVAFCSFFWGGGGGGVAWFWWMLFAFSFHSPNMTEVNLL